MFVAIRCCIRLLSSDVIVADCVCMALNCFKTNALVTFEVKLFQDYFSLLRHLSEIISFQHVETCVKLFRRLIAAFEYLPICSLLLR